jgi:hypothetical protein
MQNYVSIHEHQPRPNPALAAVHGQAAMLLRYDVMRETKAEIVAEIDHLLERCTDSEIAAETNFLHQIPI